MNTHLADLSGVLNYKIPLDLTRTLEPSLAGGREQSSHR
jgi:hypothetical protein